MSNLTPRLGLKKPLGTESADISVPNENMDNLDDKVTNRKGDTLVGDLNLGTTVLRGKNKDGTDRAVAYISQADDMVRVGDGGSGLRFHSRDNPVLNDDITIWTDISTGLRSYARMYKSGNQNISAGATTKVIFNAETFDHLSEADTTTGEIVVKKAGIYALSAKLGFNDLPVGTGMFMCLFINGSVNDTLDERYISTAGAFQSLDAARFIKLSAGDRVGIGVNLTNASYIEGTSNVSFFEMVRVA